MSSLSAESRRLGWHDVGEEMPAEDARVLTWIGSSYDLFRVQRYCQRIWLGSNEMPEPHYWMPLPARPRPDYNIYTEKPITE